MRVKCHVTENYLEGDYGEVEGTIATCTQCSNETESYGTSEASVRRCLAQMRETCPSEGTNFYTVSQESQP